MNNYLVVLLIAHVLGDYYLQNEQIATNKDSKYRSLIVHSLIYSTTMILLSLIFENGNAFIGALIASLLHFGIDSLKFKTYQMKDSYKGYGSKLLRESVDNGKLYIIDQGLHIFTLIIINLVFIGGSTSFDGLRFVGLNQLDENLVLRVLLVVLLLMKPVNITFKKTFSMIKPVMEDDVNFNDEQSVGRIIGNLERMLIFILLLVNQYGAIGLVFTAKSITRYNKIVENKKFGEYYLLGTLYSLLATVVLYLILIKINY